MRPSREPTRGDGPSTRPLSRAENPRLAELQLLLKEIDSEIIEAWSVPRVVEALRAMRQLAQMKLDFIKEPQSEPPPRLAS
jgi:hypothetical protein